VLQIKYKMKIFVLLSVIALSQARPQELLDSSEVELIEPVANEGEDTVGRDPVILVVRPSFSGNNFPFPGGFPFRNTPRIPSLFGSGGGLGPIFGEEGEGGLRDFLAGRRQEGDEEEDEEGRPCGPICTMFKLLGGIQGEIDDIHREMHGGEAEETNGGGGFPFPGGFPAIFGGNNPDFDLNNSTYEEKELEDGSIVRINRTVLSDSDDNGNQFFFHSSVIHNFGDDIPEVDIVAEDDLTPDQVVGQVDLEEPVEVMAEELLPEADEALNEIDETVVSEEFPSAEGVDEGLAE